MVWKKKCKALRIFILISFLVFVVPQPQANAQDPAAQEHVWTDEEWKKATEGLDYSTKPKKEEQEDRTKEVQRKQLNFPDFLNRLINAPLFKIISVLLIIGGLVFLIIRLIKANTSANDKRLTEKDVKQAFLKIENDLPDADVSSLLSAMLDAKDYKSTVRLLYLNIIQQLHLNKQIVWKKDKTNNDYLREMRNDPSYPSFREVTLLFEVIWYGDSDIDAISYNKVAPAFKNYLTTLKNEPH